MQSIRPYGQQNSSNVLYRKNRRDHNQSLTSGNSSNNKDSSSSFSQNKFLVEKQAEYLKKTADKEINNNKYNNAIYLYNLSINKKADNPETYYYLAKAYKDAGDNINAINTYRKLLLVQPDDKETLTLIGECYKDTGDYKTARSYYSRCVQLDPKYDFAARSLKELDYLEMAKKNPEKAKQLRSNAAYMNLSNSLNLVKTAAPPELVQALKGIDFSFNSTRSLSGHQNIAQYECDKNRIVVSDKYALAAPEVVASYIAHEAVHAKDRDPFTSIREEQDGYRAAVKFWINNNHGIQDPEMDYAKQLYTENPKKLDEKVRQIYSSRDSEINETSPYHQLMAKALRGTDNKFNQFSNNYKAFLPRSQSDSKHPEKRMLLEYMV